jgi:hypothetical protein
MIYCFALVCHKIPFLCVVLRGQSQFFRTLGVVCRMAAHRVCDAVHSVCVLEIVRSANLVQLKCDSNCKIKHRQFYLICRLLMRSPHIDSSKHL